MVYLLWHKFQQGLNFVFAKVSEGTGFADKTFPHYRTLAGHIPGVLFGGYHFAHPENMSPVSEAELFMEYADLRSGMPAWIYYETYSGTPSYDAQWINTFRNHVRANYHNAKVGLYADLTGMHRVAQHVTVDGFWLAFYNNDLETPTGPMPAGTSWNIHQYEIVDNIDRDYSRWTLPQMKQNFSW